MHSGQLRDDNELSASQRNDLAAAYMNRGVARSDTGEQSGAIEDYNRAIEGMEVLRELLEPAGQWPPAWRNDLAGAYINRGVARRATGEQSGAIEDYSLAIEGMEALRELLEPAGQWPPAWRNDLAAAYMNRGTARSATGEQSGAIEDYNRAIEGMEALRELLEPAGQWPPAWRNSLAGAYMNRGNARSDTGEQSGAIEDYSRAIEGMEALRELLEPAGQWPPAWRNHLAIAYSNRAITRRDTGDLAGADADEKRANQMTS